MIYASFTITTIAFPSQLEPDNVPVPVHVRFDPRGQEGRFADRLEFVFQGPDNGAVFVITRPLRAIVGNNDLAAPAPAMPWTRVRQRGTKKIIIAGGEELFSPSRFARRLGGGDIPEDIKQILTRGTSEEQIEGFRTTFMPDALTIDSYNQYWSNLIHAERIQAE